MLVKSIKYVFIYLCRTSVGFIGIMIVFKKRCYTKVFNFYIAQINLLEYKDFMIRYY